MFSLCWYTNNFVSFRLRTKFFEIGVLGFGGENEVVEEVFGFRNKVYLLSRCYFIILNIKFIIWCKLLEISNNYVITISYIYIYISK